MLALVPTAALLIGAFAASASLDLPPLLHAYPLAIATRFFFATLLVYAILFALAAGSIRTTVMVLTGWILLLVGGNLAIDFVGTLTANPELAGFNFTDWVFDLMTRWPGPFYILTGNWAFIDV
jgi:hypothetical protein